MTAKLTAAHTKPQRKLLDLLRAQEGETCLLEPESFALDEGRRLRQMYTLWHATGDHPEIGRATVKTVEGLVALGDLVPDGHGYKLAEATSTPDLKSYDWWVIASSAGKDSQAMLDRMVELADINGVPRSRLIVVHADLGRVEWKGTTELAREQAAHYGLRFEIVERELGDLLDHVRAMGKWPMPTQRYCTSDHKRDQIKKLLTRLSRETRSLAVANGARSADVHVRILNCVGMRSQESSRRAKLEPLTHDKKASCGYRTVDVWLPIFDWTVEDVWARIKTSGVRHHWAYDLGMERLSCVFCILARKSDLLIAARANPELLDTYVELEREIGHTFTKRVPIESIRDEVMAAPKPQS